MAKIKVNTEVLRRRDAARAIVQASFYLVIATYRYAVHGRDAVNHDTIISDAKLVAMHVNDRLPDELFGG